MESRRWQSYGKRPCLVCDSIITTTTFITEACRETFKIQKGSLNCDSEKVLFLLKWQVCSEVSYVGKAKAKFSYRINNCKSNHRAFRKGKRKLSQERFHVHYCLDDHNEVDVWNFLFLSNVKQISCGKTEMFFWQHRSKTFYLIGLNENKEYLSPD